MKRRSFLLGAMAAPLLVKTGVLELTNTQLIRPKYAVMFPKVNICGGWLDEHPNGDITWHSAIGTVEEIRKKMDAPEWYPSTLSIQQQQSRRYRLGQKSHIIDAGVYVG